MNVGKVREALASGGLTLLTTPKRKDAPPRQGKDGTVKDTRTSEGSKRPVQTG